MSIERKVFIGMDVSKGYVDVAAVNNAGSVLPWEERFDDTSDGHESFVSFIESRVGCDDSKTVIIGLESSGGLERNWYRFIRKTFPDVKLHLLNPLAVKRFGERKLHRSVTDRLSALNIAQYLRLGLSPGEISPEPHLDGALSFYRYIRNQISGETRLRNELQSIMVRVQPELVQYCRAGIPGWILRLVAKYPTARELARASVKNVEKIPYVTSERASSLIEAAKKTVASQYDYLTGVTVKKMSRSILSISLEIDKMKNTLINSLKNDPAVELWTTFPGIGLWSAVCLKLEYGNIERFYSSQAAAAYSGLDPCVLQSGDSVKRCGISRKGRRQIRAILYPVALSAIRCNPVIGEFYSRLRSSGKNHKQAITACMRKTAVILYAMAVSGKPFEPKYAEKKRSDLESNDNNSPVANHSENLQNFGSITNIDRKQIKIIAPVTRREAKKRLSLIDFANGTQIKRGGGLPHTVSLPQMRGHAATPEYNTSCKIVSQ